MKITRTLLVVLAALVVVPSALAGQHAAPARAAATTACKAERAALGKPTFRELYGARALQTCVREHAAEARGEARNAAQACRAERRADPAAFRATYGTNRNKRNAMGKCVSKKTSASMRAGALERVEAARGCRDERAEDPDLFAETYGSEADALALCADEALAAGDDDPADENDPTDEDDPADDEDQAEDDPGT